MLRTIAIIFGIAFIFAGVAGFFPSFIHDNLLFGLFEVNAVYPLVYIAIGIIGIMCASKYRYTVWYFRIIGIIYGSVAILGFVLGGELSFLMTHVNMADNVLHTVIAIIALYLGFSAKLSQHE